MIEKAILNEIVQTYSTPIYVIDEKEIEKATNEISASFRDFSTKVHIAYPYKANPLRKICEYMHHLGWWAEVASSLEVEMALQVGVVPSNIIFNAPYKSDADINYAIGIGCKIHLDNFDEIKQIQKLVQPLGDLKVQIGIRLSSSSNSGWDRFGFRIIDEAYDAVEQILDIPNLVLVGIHGHRSNVTNLTEYREFISNIFEFASRIKNKYRTQLKYIDIGSGFAVNEPRPFQAERWLAPSMVEYSNIVSSCWQYSDLGNDIDLIIEPGRRSVASCATLLTKVTNIKFRNDKMIATVDSALNFIPGAEIYRYTISSLQSDSETEYQEYMICGCLCDSLDIITPSVQLPILKTDDLISISNVGGYDIARSFTWQLPLPPILLLDKNGTIRLIREKGKLAENW